MSLNSATVPSDWKKTIVIPIYKRVDRSAFANYRPISLTSVVCKQLEHALAGYLRQVWDKTGYTRDMGLDRDTLVKVKSSQCART